MTQGALSLANKYRPLSFDDGMIGQKHIVEILKNKMKSDSSALQNYLFYGPR
jgi:DNA polymerase III gamma/tau subunit